MIKACVRIVRKKSRKKMVIKSKRDQWIEHVMAYKNRHGCTYGEALTLAAPSWHKKNKKKTTGKKKSTGQKSTGKKSTGKKSKGKKNTGKGKKKSKKTSKKVARKSSKKKM
jgi:hypothetical protein